MAVTSNKTLFQYNVDNLTHKIRKLYKDDPVLERRRLITVKLKIAKIKVNNVRVSDGEIVRANDVTDLPHKVQFAIPPDVFDDKTICMRFIMRSLANFHVKRPASEYFAPRIFAYVCQLAERVPPKGMDYEADDIQVYGDLSMVKHRIIDEESVLKGLKEEVSDCCAICLDEPSGVREFTVTPCSHVFHSRCIGPWLSKRDSCPMCRRPVRLSSD